MKINIKIMDDKFSPRFNKQDIVVVDTQAKDKPGGIVLARPESAKRSDNLYKLLENISYTFLPYEETQGKEKYKIIGWAVEVISIKKI